MEFVKTKYIEAIQAEDKEHDRAFLSELISLEPEGKVSLGVIEQARRGLAAPPFFVTARSM